MSDQSSVRVSPSGPVSSRGELFGLACIFAGIVWFYAYIGIPPLYPVRFTKESANYYNQLTDGFLAGRLGFKIDPPPALIALRDPYDPVQRQQTGIVELHDATYYKGRYYLYFGVTPALTLFLPFKAITGLHFPQSFSTVIFCAAGYWCSLGLLVGIRRRYFPETGTGYVWLAAVMLGLGNFCAAMLARNSIWEMPIACAYFYSTLGFWLLLQGLTGGARRVRWLTGASTAFGLAVGSRPHFIFGAAVLCGLWAGWTWWRWRREGGPLAPLRREAAAVVVPLGLIVAGLLLYNYGRFENPFEFGQKYQLAGNRQVDSQLMSPRFFPINSYHYLLARSQVERFFPFFDVIRGYSGVRPVDYGGAENPYGLLVNMPFSWLALLAPLIWARKFRRDGAMGAWLLIFGLSFLALASAVMCFAWSANRYMVDFIPTLLLVALLGLFMLSRVGETSRLSRVLVGVGLLGVVGYTAAFNVLIPVRNDAFKVYRPQHLAALAHWFNQPSFWWDKFRAQPYGPVELTVRFPLGRLGKAEPLLVSGVSYKSDYLYAFYFADTRRLRLYFAHTNYNQLQSQPIAIDYRVPHRIGIAAGSLYPPSSHPFLSGWSAADVQEARETLHVTVDGVPYLMARQQFFETSPGFTTFGENNVSNYIEHKFTGEILSLRYQPLAPPVVDFAGGSFVRLGIVLPRQATGRREPITLTGAAGRSDLLFVIYESDDRVRLGFHHAGAEPVLSRSITIQPGDIQLLEASLGSFYSQPKNARERELAHLLIVRLNGQVIWNETVLFHPATQESPVVGRNSLGLDGYDAAFSGRIVAQQPMQLFSLVPDSPFSFQPYWLETGERPGYGAIRLHLQLPGRALLRPEPLLVTGASADQADYVFINYPIAGQPSFGYVHAQTAGGPQTKRVVVNPAKPLVVEIDAPSLYPDVHDEFFATRSLAEIAALKRNHARIKVNGQLLLDAPVANYESTAEQITVGVDRLAQAFGPRFSGRILSVDRAMSQAPSGFVENFGALDLSFCFSRPTGDGGGNFAGHRRW